MLMFVCPTTGAVQDTALEGLEGQHKLCSSEDSLD